MRIKTLASDRFVIVAVMVGNACPVESFIASKDKQTRVVGAGFVQMLNYIAEHGFQAAPPSWMGIPDHRDRSFRAIVTADSDAS